MKQRSDMIREANLKMECPTNREIKNYVKENYGKEILSQEIYSALGAEKRRQSNMLSAQQLSDTKKLVRKSFDGDFKSASDAILLVREITSDAAH